jgi:hypothetical protein
MEKKMATVDTNSRRNSGSDNASPAVPFLGLQPRDWLPAGRPHLSEAAAQASIAGLDIMASWLTASRQMIDLWRESVREQQDGMLRAWRQQIVGALAHDLMEETRRTAKRPSPTRTAVAQTGEARTDATRH